jgi:hypothetical protein
MSLLVGQGSPHSTAVPAWLQVAVVVSRGGSPVKVPGGCSDAAAAAAASDHTLLPLCSASPDLRRGGAGQGPLSMAAHGLGAGRRGPGAAAASGGGGAPRQGPLQPAAGQGVADSAEKPFGGLLRVLFGGCLQPAVSEPQPRSVAVA